MKHRLNGKRAADCDWKDPITAICILPINGIFPPLNTRPGSTDEPVRPLQQITLRADMLSPLGYLRLGSTPGDEANCWIHPCNIQIVEVLGKASWEDNKLNVDPDALEPTELQAAA